MDHNGICQACTVGIRGNHTCGLVDASCSACKALLTVPEESVPFVCGRCLEMARLRAENTCDACCGDPSSVKDGKCMCRGTGKMSEAAIALREELFETRRHLYGLLARIHRDGGHYIDKHGLEQSVIDADHIVADLHAGVRR